MDHATLAAALLPHVHAAGRAIMGYFGATGETVAKANGSPLSAADLAAEKALQDGLAHVSPDIPVISEEAEDLVAAAAGARRFFLVDPLDGTKEFLNGRTDFTVNVALIEDGIPTFGIIYAPALSVLYVTLARDHAAKAVLAPEGPTPALADLGLERLHVRRRGDDAGMVACVSRSHRGDRMDAFLAGLDEPEGLEVGSSLKFCMVAEGRADVYPRLGPTKEWDTAAGQAIVEAAGGHVDVVGGDRLRYGKSGADYLNPEFIAYGPRFSPADCAR